MGDDRDENGKPKLPKAQLAILAVARFAEPLAYTSVNPYLPAMVLSFGIPRSSVARTAGLITSSFSLFQSLTAVHWGKASDTYGRKPTIILGLIFTMICFLVWGTSTSVPMAITVRAIQGASNGNVGIIRTMVAEMVPFKELQPRAFSIMPLVWSMGSVLGPSFGGFLAEPVKQYPGLFKGNELLTKFPFLLPNLVAAVFFVISAITAMFFLKETLPKKRHDRDWGLLVGQKLTRALRTSSRPKPSHRRSSFVDGEATAPLLPQSPKKSPSKHAQKPPKYSEVFTSQTIINLAAYTFLAFHSVAYDQNIPVFMSYPVEQERNGENTQLPFKFSGGFGMEPGDIGTIFTVYGIACCIVQFVAYPPLATNFGVHKTLKLCSVLMPIVYFATPFTALPATHTARMVALLLVMSLKAFCVIIAFPSTTILLTNSCTSLRVLGTLNGFATMFSGLGRAAGPFSTGAVFDWGATRGYILAAYWFLGLVSIIGAIPIWLIVEGDGPDVSGEGENAEEDEESESESGSDSSGSAVVNVNGVLLEEEAIVDSEDEDEERGPRRPLMSQHQGYGAMKSNGSART